MITAWDAITARWVEQAGAEIVLVGDSLGRSALGLGRELEVTLEMILHHCAAVARGGGRTFRVGDMPFMTYRISPEQALANAGRFIREGCMEAVKLEGGQSIAPTVARLVDAGIPVLGHVGLLPQSFHAQGGYRIQGRDEAEAKTLLADARALEEAGAFAVVIEGIPPSLSTRITESIAIPTIGIGAGAGCDGQVLVLADLLGLTGKTPPRLARQYADLSAQAIGALGRFAQEVREGVFPGSENTYEE